MERAETSNHRTGLRRAGRVALLSASLLGAVAVASMAHADSTGTRGSTGMTGQAPTQAMPSQDTLNKAGAALHDVAKVQTSYDTRISSASSPKEKQGLSDQANAEAVQAIESHGISVEDYTRVVRLAQSDPQVKQKLLSAAGSMD
jgi:hypothetical protein